MSERIDQGRIRYLVRREDVAPTLDDVHGFLNRFIVLALHELDTISLWAAHTHLFEHFPYTPYLMVTSPTKRAGKSLLLSALHPLVARPWRVVDVSPAAVFRRVDGMRPTMLIDELDASGMSSHLRSLLNAGFEQGGTVPRVETICGIREVVDYRVFCPKAFAGIGRPLPATVSDRSIPIRLRRRAPEEAIERFREPKARLAAQPISRRLAAIGETFAAELAAKEPEAPSELHDRDADIWEPLLAIADLAGQHWPQRARQAAIAISGGPEDDDPAVNLLADLRTVFDQSGAERLRTSELLSRLRQLDDPQHDPGVADATRLARVLREFGIRPKTIRFATSTPKGYERQQFEETWRRYLPQHPHHPQHPQQA